MKDLAGTRGNRISLPSCYPIYIKNVALMRNVASQWEAKNFWTVGG